MTRPKAQTIVDYFRTQLAEGLEMARERARGKSKRRLVYDCCHATVVRDGRYVRCDRGYKLGAKRVDGLLTLLEALRGQRASICASCEQYEGVAGEAF